MKGLIRFIQAVLTVIWLGFLALSVVLYMNTGEDGLTEISGWSGLVISGSSMEPELAPGDLAVFTMGGESQPGDEILYRDSTGNYAVTRIIGTTEDQLILKADNQEDSLLAPEGAVLGVCVGYLPGFGEPFRFFCSLTGIIVIALAGLVLVVLPGFMLRVPAPPKAKRPRPDRSSPAQPVQRTRDYPHRPQEPQYTREYTRDSRRPEEPAAQTRTSRSRGGYTPRH